MSNETWKFEKNGGAVVSLNVASLQCNSETDISDLMALDMMANNMLIFVMTDGTDVLHYGKYIIGIKQPQVNPKAI